MAVDDTLRPVECVGAQDVTLVVKRREVVREPNVEGGIGLDERAEGVGMGELVPIRFLRVGSPSAVTR